jgi:tripartite-type tricarboxylate transporter receptor subunit TctC
MKGLRAALGLALFLTAAETYAQAPYPSRSVRIVVAYPAGGPTDVMARLVGQKLSDALGQQFYVENHAGAAGSLGTVTVANAPADGHTLLFVTPDFIVQPVVKAKAPYDAIKAFAPVTLLAAAPEMIAASPSVPARDLGELIALLRANPGKHSYATPGVGSPPHLGGEWLYKVTYGLDVVHVPFQGAAPAITSTIGGHTSLVHLAMPALTPQVRDGKLRAIAITSGKRAAALPEVPTLAESGLPQFRTEFIMGVVAPAATPREIIELLHGHMSTIVKLPDVEQRLKTLGYEPVGSTPEEFSARIRTDSETWRRVVREANIKIE